MPASTRLVVRSAVGDGAGVEAARGARGDGDFGQAGATRSRGQAHQSVGRYDDALADLNHAIDLAPHLAWPRGCRGATYRLMGRYDEALADFNHAIELDPGSAWDLAQRGETYRLMGHSDEALADLNRAIDLDPSEASLGPTRSWRGTLR